MSLKKFTLQRISLAVQMKSKESGWIYSKILDLKAVNLFKDFRTKILGLISRKYSQSWYNS